MSHLNKFSGALFNAIIGQGARFDIVIRTLGGAMTMDGDEPPVLFLDPGGAARQVVLPAAARGKFFIFVNKADAAEDLTIRNPANDTTLGTVSQNEGGIAICDGVTWSIILVGTST